MIRSPDQNSDYFDIVAVVLQGDSLATDLFILSLNYVPSLTAYKTHIFLTKTL